MSEQFESVLDRRLRDFEKIVETQLTNIQDGVNDMKNTMAQFVSKMSNLHIDYVPRTEVERENQRMNEEIQDLKREVKTLQMWRNYLTGAIAVLGFTLGLLVESHFWK
jgi:hypothetical protein